MINLPTPSSINYLWNIGSILGFILIFQTVSGLFISIHYSSNEAFESIVHISRNVWIGVETRFLHSNGASLFFILVYIHIARGIINFSFKKIEIWFSGIIILFLLIAIAFLGYVLPWGQMSFWGATVITNLASAVPFVGERLVQWLWGGFSVNKPTLNRFFSLHFFLPFILITFSIVHLIILHLLGSSNPMGINRNQEKLNFHPFFSWKDLLTPFLILFFIIIVSWKIPYLLIDPENFIIANPLNTPIHIQPEWYFLFAYALLRSIPNKLGGVIILLLRIISLIFISIKKNNNKVSKFNPSYKINKSLFFISFITLTWLGAIPIESVYLNLRKIVGLIYFLILLI